MKRKCLSLYSPSLFFKTATKHLHVKETGGIAVKSICKTIPDNRQNHHQLPTLPSENKGVLVIPRDFALIHCAFAFNIVHSNIRYANLYGLCSLYLAK